MIKLNDYKTVTKKDYTLKKLGTEKVQDLNRKNRWKNVEFRDPLTEGFKRYVHLDPCEEKFAEELDSYYDKAIKNYCGFEFFTKNVPIDKAIIRKDRIFDGRSVYQVIYCDLATEVADKEYQKKNAVHLPDDVYIPLTSQKASYRVPSSINSRAYDRTLPIRSPNNLDPNHKIREILKVTTGDTEYMGVIGKLGDRIAIEQLHGNCPPV